MINFTDDRLYVKGTCNVICEDVVTGDVLYQTNKMSTGNITPSTSLNEIRAGLGNPIAAMIPSDSQLQVDFEAADFQLWAKAAQLGATVSYNAPVPTCQTVTASGDSLSIDVSEGAPVAELGADQAYAYVQTVGAASLIATDGKAYPISAAGAISGFTAVNGTSYKVWYFVNKATAKKAVISSFIDPKVVRFIAQIAVYSNKSGGAGSQGTRVGWLYYTIPYLKLQGDATVTGDQSNNDTTKISGQAIAYDASIVSATCSDCDSSTLGYMVYTPDNAAGEILGIAVMGGVVEVRVGGTAQIPVNLVMVDGSLNQIAYSDYTYTMSTPITNVTVSEAGVITATGSATANAAGECTITYTDADGNEFTCVINVVVKAAS